MRLGRPERRALAGLGVLLGAGALEALALLVIAPDPRPLLARRPEASLEIVDRHGQPLRHLPAADGTRYRPVDLRRVSPHLVRAVLAAEDRRFFRHSGTDPWALARAAWRNLAARRVVSGGSTLSMQLARLIDPHPRGLEAKIVQVLLAQRLELALSKRAILTEYLARVPMGNRVVGLEAAASVYLGKPASDLSPAEAALLACVPRSPSRVNPWRREQELRRRRDRVLEAMGRLGWLDEVSLRAALAEPMVLARDPFRLEAPHFLGRVREEAGPPRPGERRVISTLDGPLERRVEALVRRHLERLGPHAVGHMAVAVLDVERGEWLALEGSGRGWGAPGGAIDGTRVARQPGSALKPFTYALAFDRGLTPATVIPDVPRSFPWATGTWTPRNYDDRFHGPLRARAALACSVNVPAALVLNDIGPGSLLDALREAGLTTLLGGSEDYGLGLTLGAGEVRLDELTNAYAALVRGGEWRPAVSWRAVLDEAGRVARRPSVPAPRRICSPRAAAQVVDILSDAEARAPAFGLWSVLRLPFPAMVKTGTSEGFRDNWCIGGTREVVAGVWCGNFDRSPMGNVSGVEGAGSLWREVLLAWAEMKHRGEDLASRSALQDPPPGLVRAPVCALSGLAPSPACPMTVSELLRPGDVPREACAWHARAADGSVAVRWPPLYRDWAAAEGLLRGATVASAEAPRRPRRAAERGPALEVLAPADGDSFMVAPDLPRRYQTVELRCSVRGSPREVAWLVDGRELARAGTPYSASWTIEPGEHRIQAIADGFASVPVTVTVVGGP